jgi:diaminohydroxyphosphoribosylaminopyrimidine deaminase/5-amino-6-(5-phosphoribosylamino)uracil reductase
MVGGRLPSGGESPEPDAAFMGRALELARRGLGLASPNPMVGAVLVSGGHVVGEGWHEGPGTRHAEVVALDQARDAARGATLYTTLEPCAHQGRTPPCAPRIASAGVARMVSAVQDPNPAVDGRGFDILRESGVDVEQGLLEEAASRQIAGFLKHTRTGLPYVILKAALSLDGKAAARDGSSQWITGPEARADAHLLRAAADAIVVGVGTAVADDPSLTVRSHGYRGRQPLRVVLDGQGRTPSTAKIFDGAAPVLIATTDHGRDRREEWERAGAEVVEFDRGTSQVSLPDLMEDLGKRDVQTALIEGGPTVWASSVEERIADRIVLYFGSKLLGGRDASGMLEGAGVAGIEDAWRVRIADVRMVGEDLRVEADVHRDR